MKTPFPDLPQSKQHFDILDGLRGIAAIGVVVFHFMEWVYSDFAQNFIGHGFLAVDFFFCLSGFVVGYAYDDRLAKMGVWEFFKARLIRLHPLVILGSVLGLLAFLFDPFGGNSEAYSLGRIVLIFLCSIFLIPFPVMEDRFFNLFGLNAPAWSLFWEYVANVVYALILHRLSRRYLVVLLVLAATVLSMVSYQAGNLMGGWGGDNFWDGGVRIAYSFLAGLLIYRSGWIIKNRLGFLGLAVLLSAALLMPVLAWNSYIETTVVLFYFPLLVSLGAGATLSSSLRGLCVLLGKISYPLYMTHYAVIWMFGYYYQSYHPTCPQLITIIVVGTLLLIGFAYLVMRYVDIPVRRYLYRRWKNSSSK